MKRDSVPLPSDAQPKDIPWNGVAVMTPGDSIHEHLYSTEALLPGFDRLAGTMNGTPINVLRFLKAGMPPFAADDAVAPMPYMVAANLIMDAAGDPELLVHAALWYVESGCQFLVQDQVRSPALRPDNWSKPGDLYDTSPTTAAYMAAITGGYPHIKRVLPHQYLDAPSYDRSGTRAVNGYFAALAPVGWRADGVDLACFKHVGCASYLASAGYPTPNIACMPQNATLTAQLAFEYMLASGAFELSPDFVIGPARYWLGRATIGGGGEPTFNTPADLLRYYLPTDGLAYLRQTISLDSGLPTYGSLGFKLSDLKSNLDRNTPAHMVSLAIAKYAQATGKRNLPAQELVPTPIDYNYARVLRDMLHSGPGLAGLLEWSTVTLPDPDDGGGFLAVLENCAAAVAMLGGIAATVATGGAAAPVLAIGMSLIKQAVSASDLGRYAAAAIGYSNGAWHGAGGLTHLVNVQPVLNEVIDDVGSMLTGD